MADKFYYAMLQFITDGQTVEEIIKQSEMVIKGGCRWIQVRMKDAADDDVRNVVKAIHTLALKNGATLILDDRVELANELNVDGVHLGKDDMSPSDARKILGDRAIIGATANTIDDVLRLAKLPINYLGIGPFRFTSTKKRLAPTLGLEGYIAIIVEMNRYGIKLPVVAIGGIRLTDIPSILGTGVSGVAVSGAIAHAEHPDVVTREFLEELNKNI
jgi:thiamine-phosphate pyrophosphorylase